MTVLGIVAILVALSVGIVQDGRATFPSSVKQEFSTDSTPDRMVNGFPGSVDVASVTIPDAHRTRIASSSTLFAVWALPGCLAALLALLVFRRRHGAASGPARQLWWIGAISLRAPPRRQFA